MPRPLLPPRGLFIPITILVDQTLPETVRFTWILLRCLAWGRSETPVLSMEQIVEILGKKQSAIYKHMALLRDQGALRWRSAGCGTLIVSFPDHLQDSTTSNECGVDAINSKGLDAVQSPQTSKEVSSANFPETNSINLELFSKSMESPFNVSFNNSYHKEEKLKYTPFHKSGIPQQDVEYAQHTPRKVTASPSPKTTPSQKRGVDAINSKGLDTVQSPKSPGMETKSPSPKTTPLHKCGVDAINSKALGKDQCQSQPLSLYKSLTNLTPNQPQRKLMAAKVTDLDLWRDSLEHWLSHGWNPRNVLGMLNLYAQVGPAACRFCHPRKEQPEPELIDYQAQRERDRLEARRIIAEARAKKAARAQAAAQDG